MGMKRRAVKKKARSDKQERGASQMQAHFPHVRAMQPTEEHGQRKQQDALRHEPRGGDLAHSGAVPDQFGQRVHDGCKQCEGDHEAKAQARSGPIAAVPGCHHKVTLATDLRSEVSAQRSIMIPPVQRLVQWRQTRLSDCNPECNKSPVVFRIQP